MEMIGTMPPETYKFLCVVGSRLFSPYGREVCEQLIAGLSGYPIVIVSGLAIGIDAIAHESALKAGLKTIAFPGSSLDMRLIAPHQNLGLARRIVECGGALLSPFKRYQTGDYWTFPMRNKLMAGISHATLVIEADEESGSLITAADTARFSRDLMVVPGSIFSSVSKGTNGLLREGGIAVTCSRHILEILGLAAPENKENKEEGDQPTLFKPSLSANLSPDEKMIVDKIAAPITRDDLIREIDLPAGYVNSVLVELELKGVVTERQGLLMVN